MAPGFKETAQGNARILVVALVPDEDGLQRLNSNCRLRSLYIYLRSDYLVQDL
ncbi:hypothetical protein BH20ACI3_BH20ACI3_14530 [soil metagenome]